MILEAVTKPEIDNNVSQWNYAQHTFTIQSVKNGISKFLTETVVCSVLFNTGLFCYVLYEGFIL